jgi:hypothetical protein
VIAYVCLSAGAIGRTPCPWWFWGSVSTGAISRSLQAGELISTLTLMLQLGESGQRVEA